MRIAMMTNNYKPFVGGVPISIERLADGLRRIGHEVYIFAPSYGEDAPEYGVIRYGSLGRMDYDSMVVPNMFDGSIEKKFKNLNIDIIHVQHPMLIGNVAHHLGKKYNVPVAFTYHTRYERYLHYLKPYRKLEKRAAIEKNGELKNIEEKALGILKDKALPSYIKRFADKCQTVFAPTDSMKSYLRGIGVSSRIAVLPTGLNEDSFLEEADEGMRKKYMMGHKYLFCTVSRLTKEKNLMFMMEGLRKLKDIIGDSFTMLMIGEGPMKKDLEDRAESLGIGSNVVFCGNIPNDEISSYYRICDLFLFTSKSETQGIVLLEAMSAKLPIIAVRASGVVDVVEQGENGYITEEDSEIWAERAARAVQDKGLHGKMSEAALNTAKRYMSWRVAKRAEGYYMDAVRSFYDREVLSCGGEADVI